jgi:hypothetical protein
MVRVMTQNPLSDSAQAWSLAANCLLFEEDPGPDQVNVGSDTEPQMQPRTEAWRDYYARYLLKELDGDLGRLAAIDDEYRGELRRRPSQREVREGLPELWHCVVDLVERAVTIVRTVGADTDDKARRRLVAGVDHWLTVNTLGGIAPEVQEISNATLIEELHRIDTSE